MANIGKFASQAQLQHQFCRSCVRGAACHGRGRGCSDCVAVCCSVLQSVAMCCSVLQCVAVCCSALQCVATYCSVLQCVTVCCSMLQCVAVFRSVLQHFAVRCSVCRSALQYVEVFGRPACTVLLVMTKAVTSAFVVL